MQIQLFATRSDLLSGIERIEALRDLHYALLCMLDENTVNVINTLLDVEDIGYNNSGKYVLGTQYLVVEKKHEIKSRAIKQRKGGILYDIGPLENPHSIVFQSPGIFKENYLIMGSVGTASESKESIKLYKFFKKEITRDFKKIKDLYVGPEALILAKSGYRFITMHTNQSQEYDLAVD